MSKALPQYADRCLHQPYLDYEVLLLSEDTRCPICNKYKLGEPEKTGLDQESVTSRPVFMCDRPLSDADKAKMATRRNMPRNTCLLEMTRDDSGRLVCPVHGPHQAAE